MTDKGKQYVAMLCAMTFPVAVWVHPEMAERLKARMGEEK